MQLNAIDYTNVNINFNFTKKKGIKKRLTQKYSNYFI